LLEVPVADVAGYTIKPLKWLRFCSGVITGSEGYLQVVRNNDEDKISPDLDISVTDDRRFVFHPTGLVRFIDPAGLDHLQSSQVSTESRQDFVSRVKARDVTCVLSGFIHSKAAHLIPHSKGSEYIQRLSQRRANEGEAHIEDITDPQSRGCFANSKFCFRYCRRAPSCFDKLSAQVYDAES